jgi:lipopolysaccharide/colanic/teichoic acid biosynthesis glycosyltransferase
LETTFRQERARVDRNGRCFSVVIFAAEVRRNDELAAIAAVLQKRMRSYDSLGTLDPARLALLLPESDGRGAWTFVDDALEQLGQLGHAVDCEVFTYPLQRGGRDGHGETPEDPAQHAAPLERRGARATGTDGVAQSSAPLEGTEHWSAAKAARPVQDLYPHFLEELPLWRRLVDVLGSAVLLLLLAPLFAVIALLVKLDSPGPVFFVQWRAGRGGRPFKFYKFRSMYIDADARKSELAEQNEAVGPIFKIRQDPRITRVGRFIRKASIDEMPQLWNVLIGDMTLVGPRPPTLDEVAVYERWQRERLDITGGLTCIWQVSGRSEIGFEDWVRMDLEYKRSRSPILDVKLLWRTIGAVFTGRGAY